MVRGVVLLLVLVEVVTGTIITVAVVTERNTSKISTIHIFIIDRITTSVVLRWSLSFTHQSWP